MFLTNLAAGSTLVPHSLLYGNGEGFLGGITCLYCDNGICVLPNNGCYIHNSITKFQGQSLSTVEDTGMDCMFEQMVRFCVEPGRSSAPYHPTMCYVAISK